MVRTTANETRTTHLQLCPSDSGATQGSTDRRLGIAAPATPNDTPSAERAHQTPPAADSTPPRIMTLHTTALPAHCARGTGVLRVIDLIP
jgi:hypothetical protein